MIKITKSTLQKALIAGFFSAFTIGVLTVLTYKSTLGYFLAGSLGDGSNFSIEVPKMRLLKITSSDVQDLYVGASESIISEVRINRNENHWKIEIFIKDLEPMANPIPGIYIASKEFPKELLF